MSRTTEQRRAIRRVLEVAGRPLSPQEVLERAQDQVPGLGIATVYRNLKSLTAEGWLCAVDLPGEGSRYELHDKPHHHHFQCERCGRVFDVDACPGGLDEMLPDGFELHGHEVLLYGVCVECARS